MLGYGQQASGTHPTGMHSCFVYVIHDKNCVKMFWVEYVEIEFWVCTFTSVFGTYIDYLTTFVAVILQQGGGYFFYIFLIETYTVGS